MPTTLKILVFSALILFIFFNSLGISRPVVGEAPQKGEDRFFADGIGVRVEIWIENLEIPWSLVFTEGDKALVSERPGRIRLIKDGKLLTTLYVEIEVAREGEGGLMGLALHPDFSNKPYLYAMHTYQKEGQFFNRVIRFKDAGDKGIFDRVIIDRIPGGRLHNGGRIAFGPDGLLYIATGETFKGGLAQDLQSLAGKILRLTPEGGIPRDNPFHGSSVYSYGHRNPQGLSWHPETRDLFESEHGPSGESLVFANDEINVIMKGGNYGWPKVVGAPGIKPYIDPLVVWKKTTPPSGITFYRGNLLPHLKDNLFVSTLRSEDLIRIKLKREDKRYQVSDIERWLATDDQGGKYGRLRDVVQGPEGALYFLTNNRDGRGNPRQGDDKIYRILPK
jgi:quinoprotein glucose dehydrogenase